MVNIRIVLHDSYGHPFELGWSFEVSISDDRIPGHPITVDPIYSNSRDSIFNRPVWELPAAGTIQITSRGPNDENLYGIGQYQAEQVHHRGEMLEVLNLFIRRGINRNFEAQQVRRESTSGQWGFSGTLGLKFREIVQLGGGATYQPARSQSSSVRHTFGLRSVATNQLIIVVH